MALTGQQLRQLQNALSSAFPTSRSLQQVLSFGMSVNLWTIAAERNNMSEIIFDVLQWCESQGRTAELLKVALQNNGGNALLIQADQDLSPVLAKQAAASNEVAPVTITRGRLRSAIEKGFNATELATLCADVQDALESRGVDLPVSVEEVGGATKSAQVLNLVTYLERRGHLPELIRAVQALRPGLLDER